METLSYDTWEGRTAYGQDGEKIGKITNIYYDDVSGRPEWLEVKTSFLGGTRLVPLAGARVESAIDDTVDDDDDADDRLVLAFPSERIKDAPNMDTDDDHLAPEQERELYSYYGFDHTNRTDQDFGYGTDWGKPRFDEHYDRSKLGRVGNVADRANVGTERGTVAAEATVRNQDVQVTENTEQVRLRKIQHTEMVPVTKEEVVVERTSDEVDPRVQAKTPQAKTRNVR